MTSDQLFWLDPWSAQGQVVSAKLLPIAHDLRIHAEQAIVLLAQARHDNPKLAEPDALTAMDLGARRLDLIGLKFQLAAGNRRGIRPGGRAAARQDAEHTPRTICSARSAATNGRCQDLRDAYSALKSEYSQVWLSENRPYWLNNVTVRYDLEIERWQRRGDQFASGDPRLAERSGSACGHGLGIARARCKARTEHGPAASGCAAGYAERLPACGIRRSG